MRRREDSLDKLLKAYYKHRLKRREPMRDDSIAYMPSLPCAEVSSIRKNCPSISQLGSYIDGVLEGEEKRAIEAHIEICRKCRDKVEVGSELVCGYKEGKLETTPEYIPSFIFSKLKTYHRKGPKPKKE